MSRQKANTEENIRRVVEGSTSWREKIRKIQPEIIDWAFRYETFKQELLSDPKGVIEVELGTKFPNDIEICVLEETEKNRYWIIYNNPYEELCSRDGLDTSGAMIRQAAHLVLRQQSSGSFSGIAESRDIEAKLLARAWEDEVFKQELIMAPLAVFNRELGAELQEGLEVKVVEETPTLYFILLPWSHESFEIYNEHLKDQDFLVSAANTKALVEYIAANAAGTTATKAGSSCCCGIFTISSCF